MSSISLRHVTGYTFSSDFPDALNQFIGSSGYSDAFVVKIDD